jgi:hypothetical protein
MTQKQGGDMDVVERARILFRKLEEQNPRAATEVARRAFRIQEYTTSETY